MQKKKKCVCADFFAHCIEESEISTFPLHKYNISTKLDTNSF